MPPMLRYEDVAYPPGTTPPTHEEIHTLHTYSTLDQPLIVHDDIPNLTLTVPEPQKAAAIATSQ